MGPSAIAVQGDVTNREDLNRLSATVKAKHGRVDILHVNAGVAEFRPVEAADDKHYDRLFDINVKGAYRKVQAALPIFADNGAIVFTPSVAAEIGMAGTSVYAATKAALRSFARTLSADLMPRGIRVNVVSPGPIETPIFGRMGMSAAEIDAVGQHMASIVPMKRIGQPIEIAKAVAFLASDDASFVTGTQLLVGGGLAQL